MPEVVFWVCVVVVAFVFGVPVISEWIYYGRRF